MTRYRLPCPCSCRIAVTSGQAGGTVRCPACGAAVAVPRLGALARLDREEGEPPTVGRSWDAARACLLAGLVVACGAVAVAVGLRGSRAGVAPIDVEAIRTAVAAADAAEVHAAWLEFARSGIVRPPVDEEQRRRRHADTLAVLEAVAWMAAVAGGVAAAGGAIVAGWRRSTPVGA